MITPRIRYFCKDYTKIENYELAVNDPNEIWVLHHRLETHFSDGTPRSKDVQLTASELKALNMYYNRPPEELIFLTRVEHGSLHRPSEQTRRKMSVSRKRYYQSKNHRQKLSEAQKGRKQSEKTKQKISEKNKGKPSYCKGSQWYNNGVKRIRAFKCPEGFVPGYTL